MAVPEIIWDIVEETVGIQTFEVEKDPERELLDQTTKKFNGNGVLGSTKDVGSRSSKVAHRAAVRGARAASSVPLETVRRVAERLATPIEGSVSGAVDLEAAEARKEIAAFEGRLEKERMDDLDELEKEVKRLMGRDGGGGLGAVVGDRSQLRARFRVLKLSDRGIHTLEKRFLMFDRLEELFLSENLGLGVLEHVPLSLRALHCCHSSVERVFFAGTMKNLLHLGLAHNHLTFDALRDVCRKEVLPSLRVLDLCFNRVEKVEDAGTIVEELKDSLEHVWFEGCPVSLCRNFRPQIVRSGGPPLQSVDDLSISPSYLSGVEAAASSDDGEEEEVRDGVLYFEKRTDNHIEFRIVLEQVGGIHTKIDHHISTEKEDDHEENSATPVWMFARVVIPGADDLYLQTTDSPTTIPTTPQPCPTPPPPPPTPEGEEQPPPEKSTPPNQTWERQKSSRGIAIASQAGIVSPDSTWTGSLDCTIHMRPSWELVRDWWMDGFVVEMYEVIYSKPAPEETKEPENPKKSTKDKKPAKPTKKSSKEPEPTQTLPILPPTTPIESVQLISTVNVPVRSFFEATEASATKQTFVQTPLQPVNLTSPALEDCRRIGRQRAQQEDLASHPEDKPPEPSKKSSKKTTSQPEPVHEIPPERLEAVEHSAKEHARQLHKEALSSSKTRATIHISRANYGNL